MGKKGIGRKGHETHLIKLTLDAVENFDNNKPSNHNHGLCMMYVLYVCIHVNYTYLCIHVPRTYTLDTSGHQFFLLFLLFTFLRTVCWEVHYLSPC